MHEKSLGWWVLKPDHQEGFLVQITVSLTVDLPATADVNTVEPLILDAGRQAMRQALHLAALRAQAHVACCPRCQHPTLHADGTARRVVLASFGRVAVPVLRKRCAACGHRFRAATAFFAPLDGANVTAELGRQAAQAGTEGPFARAAQTLNAGEAAALLSRDTASSSTVAVRGVDAADPATDTAALARALARCYRCVAAVTGQTDAVSDGQRVALIDNGHPLLAHMSGTGDMATGVVAACAAVERDALRAATAALLAFRVAGAIAAHTARGPGSLRLELLDALASLDTITLIHEGRIRWS